MLLAAISSERVLTKGKLELSRALQSCPSVLLPVWKATDGSGGDFGGCNLQQVIAALCVELYTGLTHLHQHGRVELIPHSRT